MNIEITVLVHVTRVSSAQPAIAIERLGGCLGQIPVADHVRTGTGRNLADVAWRQFVAVGTQDREFNARQRLAGRAHPFQSLDMVFRRQRHDGAGGLGHAVHLHEAAAEYVDAFLKKCGRNRRRAIEHVFQPRKIYLARPRLPHYELHRGRHHE